MYTTTVKTALVTTSIKQ